MPRGLHTKLAGGGPLRSKQQTPPGQVHEPVVEHSPWLGDLQRKPRGIFPAARGRECCRGGCYGAVGRQRVGGVEPEGAEGGGVEFGGGAGAGCEGDVVGEEMRGGEGDIGAGRSLAGGDVHPPEGEAEALGGRVGGADEGGGVSVAACCCGVEVPSAGWGASSW